MQLVTARAGHVARGMCARSPNRVLHSTDGSPGTSRSVWRRRECFGTEVDHPAGGPPPAFTCAPPGPWQASHCRPPWPNGPRGSFGRACLVRKDPVTAAIVVTAEAGVCSVWAVGRESGVSARPSAANTRRQRRPTAGPRKPATAHAATAHSITPWRGCCARPSRPQPRPARDRRCRFPCQPDSSSESSDLQRP